MEELQPLSPAGEQKASYTKPQKLLLWGALALGILWMVLMFDYTETWMYCTFWMAYLALYLTLNFDRLRANRTGWAVAVPAVLLALLLASGWNQGAASQPAGVDLLISLNILAVPALLMLHMAVTTVDAPVKREGAIAEAVVSGIFVRPFARMPKMFGALASALSGKERSETRRVIIGFLIGIPLAAVVLAMLLSADDMMQRLFSGWFSDLRFGELLLRFFITAAVMAATYSFLYSTAWDEKKPLPAAAPQSVPPVTLLIVIGLLLVVYAVFAYVQFTYLFGGRLPADLTYAEYARKGFGELITVSLINFTLLGVSVRYGKENRVLRIFEYLLLAATALLLASAITRLLLYIGAYRLTFNRILPLWFMAYLCFLVVLSAVRLAREKTPLTRIAAFAFIYWYLALNIPDWGAIISRYNAL